MNIRLTTHTKNRLVNIPECRRIVKSKLDCKLWAISHGVPVPQLYWSGMSDNIPPRLPEKYVLKPDCGHSSRGVHINPQIDNVVFNPSELIIIEEYIPGGIDYKFWMAKDEVVTIQVIDRNAGKMRFYDEDWKDGLVTRKNIKFDYVRPKPKSLSKMIDVAKTLGMASPYFIRIDLFDGPYLNEVSFKMNGLKNIDDEADLIIGEKIKKYNL